MNEEGFRRTCASKGKGELRKGSVPLKTWEVKFVDTSLAFGYKLSRISRLDVGIGENTTVLLGKTRLRTEGYLSPGTDRTAIPFLVAARLNWGIILGLGG